MRQIYLSFFTVTLFLFSCNTSENKRKSPGNKSPESIKPNIIVILTDDQGYKDVGFNGATDIRTPNIDRIAKNGTVFTNGYVSYAVCGPSRAGLITGRYQDRFGFSRNPLFAPKDSLQGVPRSEEMLSEVLSRAAYKSIALGKWHMGAHHSLRPLQRGFDEFFGFLTGGHRYFPEDWTRNDISEVTSQFDAYRTKLLKNDKRIEEKEYLTDALSREAVNYIERNKEEPFFMYLAYNAPHTPLQATEKYLSRYPDIKDEKRRTYAAMVSAVDDGVGMILDKLEDLGLDTNTIVFFLSDNGGPEEHNGSDNGVLRAGKGSLHEGGIRVPFAVQWPGVIPENTTYQHPVISLDIFATAVSQAGVTPKNKLDGKDLIPYLTGKENGPPHEQLFWRNYDAEAFAIRSGDRKLVRNKSGETGLYNLADDIGESAPLQDSATIKVLRKNFGQWNDHNALPAFLGLRQNKEYNKTNPERFNDNEKY